MTRIALRLAALATLALAGCGGILPQPAAPPPLYRLTPAAQGPAAPQRAVPTQLVIDAPEAEAALDTTRIALARGPTSLDYFADAAWTDRLSSMLQALLIASFDKADRIAAVGPQNGELRANVALVSSVTHFEAAYGSEGPPKWRIEITAKLVRMPERTFIAARSFAAEVPAAHNTVPAIVTAADDAWHRVASDVVDWTATTLARPGRS